MNGVGQEVALVLEERCGFDVARTASWVRLPVKVAGDSEMFASRYLN